MEISKAYLLSNSLRRGSSSRIKHNSAFSIVELAIVLLIIGIITAIAVPKYDYALKTARVRGAAIWIKSDLAYAKRLAQQSSSSQSVTFNTVTESYILVGAEDINQRGQVYTVSLNDSKFRAGLESVDFGGSSTVSFDIHGRPDNEGVIVVRSGDISKTIQVDSAGQITIL